MRSVLLGLVAAVAVPWLTLAQPSPPAVLSRLVWFDRAGARLGTIGPVADHGNLELSPDGTRVAVAVTDNARGTRDIWIYDTGSGSRTRFTSEPADENWSLWSPDGRRVLFNSFAPDHLDLFESPAAGAISQTSLLMGGDAKWPVSWSPDGRFVLFVTNNRTTSNDVWVLPLGGDRKPYALLRTEASENWATFSPDGRWVAFSSTESGQSEVHVAPFPATGRTWRVSPDGGSQARWRRDGSAIFYLAPDRTLVAASVKTAGAEFAVTGYESLFTLSFPYGAYHAFDVTADGRRILVNTVVGTSAAPRVVASLR
jgi:dipeptidyl aminopeptidase/acylaminoacyl peptidase